MSQLHGLLLGALAMGTIAIGVIFLRYWRDGGDRFFLYFALSFFAQAVNRVTLPLSTSPQEGMPWQYGIRLLAYLLILVAIIDKNRPQPKRPTA